MHPHHKLMALLLTAALALGGGAMTPGVRAQALAPEAALERLLSAERVQEAWFAPSFLAQVPVTQVQQLVDRLHASLGGFVGVRRTADGYEVTFERGTLPVP